MTAEAPNPTANTGDRDAPVAISHPILEAFLMTTLEQLDGFCLDNESDRVELVPLLAAALIQATQSGDLILQSFPLEPDSTLSDEAQFVS